MQYWTISAIWTKQVHIGPCVMVFFPTIVYARLILHKMTCWPLIRRVLMLTLFPGCTLVAGPKHSTSVPYNAWVAVPLNVDVKEVVLVPGTKRLSGLAVKAPLAPQTVEEVDLCSSPHSLFPPTLQMVTPFKSPVTVHLKVKVSPEHVGGAAVNCPATSAAWKTHNSQCLPYTAHKWYVALCFACQV